MANKIVLKKSSVAAKVPVAGDLDFGELAINYTDGKLYFKKADNTIDAFTTAAASAPVTSVGGNIGDITDAQLLASIKNVDGTGSGLDADTLDGNHASAFYLASNPNGYTSNTGTVTSVGATAPLVSSGGTAPSISIPAANSTTNGYMSSAYASKLDGIAAGATANTGTVTSVSGTGGYGGLTLSGTITSSGSLTLGGTPTGTWPISITGSAATVGTIGTTQVTTLYSPNGATVVNPDTASAMPAQGQSFIHTLGTGPSANDGHILGMSWANTTSVYGAQIWLDTDPTNRMAIRSRSSAGVWNGWSEVLTSNNYTSYSPSLTGSGASGTWGINITGNAATASNSSQLNGLSSIQLFNNMGGVHGTQTDFNAISDFGVRYVQGTTNGPGTGSQYYGFTLGLGNDYAYSSYASQLYWPRTPLSGSPYLSVRFREGGSWGSWSKIYAGYADSAGSVAWTNVSGRPTAVSSFTNDSGYLTSSTGVTTTNNTSLNSDTRNTRGVTRLYRRDDNSDYSVQTYWTGSHWMLYGYVGDSNHAGCRVAYADSAGNGGVTSVNGATGAVTISALTDGGASFSGSSGYQKLSNGWIIQWGLYDRGGWTGNMYENGENISFPITFPNACRSITTSPYTGGNNNTTWSSEPKVYSYTNSSWKRTGDGHRWIFWIAIGH